MDTSIIPRVDFRAIEQMKPAEAQIVVNQMTTVVENIRRGQQRVQGMASTLENQPWWKRMIYTITGKNRATVAEIEHYRDYIIQYISDAICILIQRVDFQDTQIVAIKETVNRLNVALAVTNNNLDQAVKATLSFRDQTIHSMTLMNDKIERYYSQTQSQISSLRSELIETITQLSNALNDKLEQVDRFHMLIEEINVGQFNKMGLPKIVTLLLIISRIDESSINNPRKMEILKSSLRKAELLSPEGEELSEYITAIVNSPADVTYELYRLLCCFDGNSFSELFTEAMEQYSFIPELERKATVLSVLIESICQKRNYNPLVSISSEELFDYFIPSRKEYLQGAECNITRAFLNGNYKAVLPFVKVAAARQESRGIYLLSLFYLFGFDTVRIDCEEAQRVLSAGASSNDPILRTCYIIHCCDGDKQKNEFQQIRKSIQELAENGDPFAQTELGVVLLLGEDKNEEKALFWLQKASLQPSPVALFYLASLYENGDSPYFDAVKAFHSYEKAASHGVVDGQIGLGLCYEEGFGTEKDTTLAKYWFERACKQGSEVADEYLDELEEELEEQSSE